MEEFYATHIHKGIKKKQRETKYINRQILQILLRKAKRVKNDF